MPTHQTNFLGKNSKESMENFGHGVEFQILSRGKNSYLSSLLIFWVTKNERNSGILEHTTVSFISIKDNCTRTLTLCILFKDDPITHAVDIIDLFCCLSFEWDSFFYIWVAPCKDLSANREKYIRKYKICRGARKKLWKCLQEIQTRGVFNHLKLLVN